VPKMERTPRSRVKQALRLLWMRSRERAKAIKDHNRSCIECGAKASVAVGKEVKLEVHHINGVDWEELIDLVYERLLVDPKFLEPLCKDCHSKK